jgi:probable HAF family extracellular repeat protein
MMKRSGFMLLGTVFLSGMAFAIPAVAQPAYTVTDLGTLPEDNITIPRSVNQNGHVAGSTEDHAFRWIAGAIQNLGTLPGGDRASASSINDKDDVAGASQFHNGGSIMHATLFRNGTATDLGFIRDAGNYSFATGINKRRVIVGYGAPSASSTSTIAFIWDKANGIRELPSLGGQFSRALSINNKDHVTGSAQTGSGFGTFHAFLWNEVEGLRDLGTLAGDSSQGNFINIKGHVTGYSSINTFDNRLHAFLYKDGRMRDLGSLGGNSQLSDFSFGNGINRKDIVVGSTYLPYQGGALYQVAFVWQRGTMKNLEKLLDASGTDYRLYDATAINDAGQITVDAIKNSTNEKHAVLLTPAS